MDSGRFRASISSGRPSEEYFDNLLGPVVVWQGGGVGDSRFAPNPRTRMMETPSRLEGARLQRDEQFLFGSRIRRAAGRRRIHRLARAWRELDLALQEPGPAEIFGDKQCGLSHSLVHPHISPELAFHPVGLKFPDPGRIAVTGKLELAPPDEIIVILGIQLELDEDVATRKRHRASRLDLPDRPGKGRTHERLENPSGILFGKDARSKDSLDRIGEKRRDRDGDEERDETTSVLFHGSMGCATKCMSWMEVERVSGVPFRLPPRLDSCGCWMSIAMHRRKHHRSG